MRLGQKSGTRRSSNSKKSPKNKKKNTSSASKTVWKTATAQSSIGINGVELAFEQKPKYVSSTTIVGQISPDLTKIVFGPSIIEKANTSLEKYAEEYIFYEEQYKEIADEMEVSNDEVDNDNDNNNDNNNNKTIGNLPHPPVLPLFHSEYVIKECQEMLDEVSEHFVPKPTKKSTKKKDSTGSAAGWKVYANAARFERRLDERYGVFRPLINKYPEIENLVKNVQIKHATGYFSAFRQSDPPMSRSTSIVLLVMMKNGNIQMEALALVAIFLLVGLQPWALVVIVAIGRTFLEGRKKKPIGKMKKRIPLVPPYYEKQHAAASGGGGEEEDPAIEEQRKHDLLQQPVGTPLGKEEKIDGSDYDTIILGHGPDALYAGSLLTRSGRKVLVLSSRNDASGCVTMANMSNTYKADKYAATVPFDLEDSSISRISTQQSLLAPALCTTTDLQGGVRFAQVGTEADGYAFEILSIPGVGTNDGSSSGESIPFVLRAAGGRHGFMEDVAMFLGDGLPGIEQNDCGDSTSGAYLTACDAITASSGRYYLGRVLPESTSKSANPSDTSYGKTSIQQASRILDNLLPVNAHIRSLMAGIGLKGENMKPSMTSIGPHATNISAATSGEGMHYPVGGPRALCRALANVIEASGGRIVTDVKCSELLFEKTGDKNDNTKKAKAAKKEKNKKPKTKEEEEEEAKKAPERKADKDFPPPPRCIGVKCVDGSEFRLSTTGKKNTDTAVISMAGFIDTFIRLIPEEIRTKNKVPQGLPALAERRPVIKFLYLLDGKADDLSVTGADYYRLPGASIARDEIDPATGQVKLGEIGWPSDNENNNDADEESSNALENTAGTPRGKRGKTDTAPTANANTSDKATVTTISVAPAGTTKKNNKNNYRNDHRRKFLSGESYIHVSFPSAKDPSFQVRHPNVTTCVVTIEADDDYVREFPDSRPKLFFPLKPPDAGTNQRLHERVKNDILSIYPQLQGKIINQCVCGPFSKGLRHTPERYAAKGVRADTPYPGLFVGGSDLSVGDSFSASIVAGWLVSNAVAGYQSTMDLLYLEKNITTDLARFLDAPDKYEDDDEDEDEDMSLIAVPFRCQKNKNPEVEQENNAEDEEEKKNK